MSVATAHAAVMNPARGWFEPLQEWPRTVLRMLESEPAIVRVVVANVQGSAPREAGAMMLVGSFDIVGTIGGGRLEALAIELARNQLELRTPAITTHRFVLGTELAQCCGGIVELWIECVTRAERPILMQTALTMRSGATSLTTMSCAGEVTRQVTAVPHAVSRSFLYERSGDAILTLRERLDRALPPLWLYGAGHVGQAIARVVADLPFHLTWIDSREGLPPAPHAENIDTLQTTDPLDTVVRAPAGARFLVMTHDHSLDFALCRAILERGDAAWLGLIGSKSKAARFRSRLRATGLSEARIPQLTCPIGVEGIDSKLPAVIAVAVAAQLLQTLEHDTQPANEAPACHGNCQQCGQGKVSS